MANYRVTKIERRGTVYIVEGVNNMGEAIKKLIKGKYERKVEVRKLSTEYKALKIY